jgi:ribosome-associated protein
MELKALQRTAIDALEDVKAQDIQVFDTLGQSSEFDRVIVASGTSNRQTRALAWNVAQKVKEAGGRVVSVEGADSGEWVLVDLGDIVVHIMVPPIRAYYALEEIWGAKPLRAKPAAKATAKSAVKKAAKQAPMKPKKKAEKKAVEKPARQAHKAAGKKTAARAPARKRPAAKKSTARQSAVRRSSRHKTATRAPATKAAQRKSR